MSLPFFTTASREELDIELEVIEGEIPNDMDGVVYINSSVGTINSNGIPFPTTRPDGTYNRELGSPLLGGDSMIYKLDFNQTQNEIAKIKLTSRLLKTPCYYADEATRYYLEKENKKILFLIAMVFVILDLLVCLLRWECEMNFVLP